MANYGARENCIEWLRGENRVVLSLSDPEMIRDIYEMSKKDGAIEIVEKNRYTLCATIPLAYLKIQKARRIKTNVE